MSHKSARIAELISHCQGQQYDAHYLGYFELFNCGLYYESHDVLEELWLPVRQQEEGAFYKGLIQLAGAFVHLQKERLRPASALFKLAMANLLKYPSNHHDLEIPVVIQLIERWLEQLAAGDFKVNPLRTNEPPHLRLRR